MPSDPVAMTTAGAPAAADTFDALDLASCRAALVERVDRCKKGIGVVAAVVDPFGATIISHGRVRHDDTRLVDQDSVFAVGCVIKVFDALLLADMVERGVVALSDPVERYLPPDVRVPHAGQPITLQHLALHTSGLPGRRTAPVHEATTRAAEGLYRFLSAYTLPREVGAAYEHSQIGSNLLRHALVRCAGVDYETLLRTTIAGPLQMRSTGFGERAGAGTAFGHNDRLEPVDLDPAELCSTARDLTAFLQTCLGFRRSPVDKALARLLSVRCPSAPKTEAALGWQVETHCGDEIISQHGVSAGFRSWIGYRPAVARGVAILSNAAAAGGMDDIGYHVLDARYPLLAPDLPLLSPPTIPHAIDAPIEALEPHVGRYQLTPNVHVEVTRRGRQLYAAKTGREPIAIFPESRTEFFFKDVSFYELPADTRLSFRVDSDGATTGMTLRQRGHATWLPRVEGGPEPVWFGHVRAAVDRARLDRYVGSYRLPSYVAGASLATEGVVVMRAADTLFARFTDGLVVELVPQNATRFFVENDALDLQIAFEIGDTGRTTGLVVTYDGTPKHGTRIE